MDIVEFLTARLGEDQAAAESAPGSEWETSGRGYPEAPEVQITDERNRFIAETSGTFAAEHIARHDPARVLAVVAVMRRIVDLHTTGSYRTYQCGNGDHIQEWQCKRAGEPYTESRYCEVCGGSECVEVLLLASIWSGSPDYDPAWRAE